MKHITLGRTGLTVSKPGFGALPIQRTEKEAAVKLLRRAYEGGFTYFDSANAYTDSEEKLGEALKVFPLIPAIEFVGIFTKPFALMIRLFANIMAGHAIAISLVCIIFLVASKSAGVFFGMSTVSVIMSVFMSTLEVLVCFIQAMVFTMLSSIFIGLDRVEPEHE